MNTTQILAIGVVIIVAVAIGDRIALMMDGRVLQYDVPSVFYHRPVSKRSALFFDGRMPSPRSRTEAW